MTILSGCRSYQCKNLDTNFAEGVFCSGPVLVAATGVGLGPKRLCTPSASTMVLNITATITPCVSRRVYEGSAEGSVKEKPHRMGPK